MRISDWSSDVCSSDLLAVDEREQGVVAAEADAHARMELGAALANDDVAGFDRLATIDLHAEILRVGVAAVARGTYALFMCHGCFSLLLVATGDAGDLDFGVVLRSEEHTSELQSLMRISYAVFCLKKKN